MSTQVAEGKPAAAGSSFYAGMRVLPKGPPRLAVGMGSTAGWWKSGCAPVVGLDTFGGSAPANVLFKHFGFTPENVAATVGAVVKR